jgi:hypothetical protein
MCLAHQITCTCGKSSASLHARDSILPADVVQRLFCPACSERVVFDPATMLSDNGWIIEYNIDMARFMLQKVSRPEEINAGFIFDEGYFTWNGVYPGDIVDSAKERQELVKLAQTDRKKYFEEFKNWGVTRMERLAQEGWRKAHERENVHT